MSTQAPPNLVKNTNLTYMPGSPGVPMSPGSPPTPAYTAYETHYICGYIIEGASWQYVMNDQGVWQYVMVADDPDEEINFSSYTYQCGYLSVPVYYPEQPGTKPTGGTPATESSFLYDYNLGWNAGARSLGFFSGDGYTEYKVSPSLVAAVAGLNDVDMDAGYDNIDHAFYLANGVARIMEQGADKLYIGPYASGGVFKIDRTGGVVRYYINGVLKYTSENPSSGTVFLDVSMYSGGDYIESPAISGYTHTNDASDDPAAIDGALNFMPLAMLAGNAGRGWAGLTMRALTMYSSTDPVTIPNASLSMESLEMSGGTFVAGVTGSLTSRADLSFKPLTISTRYAEGAAVAFMPLVLQGSDFSYGGAAMSLLPMTIDAHPGRLAPAYALGSQSFAGLAVSGLCLTGEIGGGSQSLAPLAMLGGRSGYGEARMSFAAPALLAWAFEGNQQASMQELVISSTPIAFYGSIDVRLYSEVLAQDDYLTLVLANAAMAESANVSETMSYSAIMQALMACVAEVSAGIPMFSQDGEVWVVNDTTGASTSYEGYSFNSFAKYQDRYLAAKAGGVYLLGGETDAGAPIRASISLGKQDFGSTAMKTVSSCYIGVASSGNIYLKVLANGTSYLYKTVRSDDYLRTQRVTVGRGLRSTHITFELYNEAGADFELASVEFEAAVLSRRI